MTRAFGASLRLALASCSRSRLAAFGAGFAVTGLLQSSTATGLLLSSFSSRGLVALPVTLAMMLGADVGTAAVAQVFTLDVKWTWSILAMAGVGLFMSASTERVRAMGRILIGLALMLLALTLIGEAAGPLARSEGFRAILGVVEDEPVALFLLAALATWLAHSSLSVVLVVMSLSASSAVSTEAALALVLGANAGGALAPYLALSRAGPAARRVPLGNLVMRASAAVLVLMLLPVPAEWLASSGVGAERLPVIFHLGFNLATAAVFLPLVDLVARLCHRLVPDAPAAEPAGQVRHLDSSALDSPAEALACATREALHIGERIAAMMRLAMVAVESGDARIIREAEQVEEGVDRLYEQVKLYLVQLSRQEMTEAEARRYVEVLTFATNLEHVGDIIDKGILDLAAKKIRHRSTFSPEGLADLRAFHARVTANLKLALNVFTSRDAVLARRLVAEKAALRAEEQAAAERHFARLRQGRPESVETSSIHLDLIRDLKRVNGHLAAAAYPILEAEGELGDTRLRTPSEAVRAAGPAGRPVS
jgi:phosphate:Na+ symporter